MTFGGFKKNTSKNEAKPGKLWKMVIFHVYTTFSMAMQKAVQKAKKWPESRKMMLQFYTGILHGRVGGSAKLENMTKSEKRGFLFQHGPEHSRAEPWNKIRQF